MSLKAHILTLFIGALAGGFLGWVSVNIIILLTIPLSTNEPFLDILFSEFLSSPAAIFQIALIIIGSVILGATLAYAVVTRRSLLQQTAKLTSSLKVNKTKDEFISMVLHHLRTPLSGMKWSLKSILGDLDNEDAHKPKVLQLYEENDRALNAVEHLIQASQASMGRVVYDFQILGMQDLQHLIKESVAKLHSMAQEKKISISIEMPPASKNSVRVDKEKIATIVQTLIENAVMYTNKEGSIQVRSEEKQSNFFLHISDTGIGIPAKDWSKVFLQFFRSKNAIQMQPSGFGIGLFLVKAFLLHHQGEISFTTKEGKGSTFSFRLPIIDNPTEKFLEKLS